MSGTIQAIDQIVSLEALRHSLSHPLAENEWGILALDLDQTLIQGKPTLGNEHFYQFLKQQNKARGINPDAHYFWTAKIRAKVTYETCESVDSINRILRDFRAQGWSIRVLTSRGIDMEAVTKQHLEDSKLDLTLEDVIFKKLCPKGNGTLLSKDKSLINWMEMQTQWETCKKIRILFPDDCDKYCKEVACIAEQVKKATVTCLHYIGALPNPNLSESQMRQLVVQLYAHQSNRPIPYTYSESDVHVAMDALEVKEICSGELYKLMMKIAECDTLPFK